MDFNLNKRTDPEEIPDTDVIEDDEASEASEEGASESDAVSCEHCSDTGLEPGMPAAEAQACSVCHGSPHGEPSDEPTE